MPTAQPICDRMDISILDLAPVPQGSDARSAIAAGVALAQAAERLGYHRYWLAEHHNMPGIASAATAVLIGLVAPASFLSHFIVFVLAEVFREGARLRRESELTI